MKQINTLKEFYTCISNIWSRIFVAIIFMIIFSFFRIQYLIEEYSSFFIKMGILDGVSVMFNEYTFPLVLAPIFAYVVVGVMNYENNHFRIVRNRLRKNIWLKSSIHTFLCSLFFTLIIVICSALISVYFNSGFHNFWTEEGGKIHKILMYHLENGEIEIAAAEIASTLSLYNSFNVILLLTVFTTMGFTVIGLFIHLVYMYTNKFTYSYISLILVMTVDTFSQKISFVFKQITIENGEWLNPNVLIWNFVYLLVLLIALYMIGKNTIDKRDFV
ncbi:hypothetical protein [Bacillus manliponensis]|uniref:hypothetical protein n=1 Tax=Bacillus manliponensis TaxID=574376 RepID=UPI003514E9A0